MTVSAQTPISSYTANGVTTAFSFPFQVRQSSDLQVQLTPPGGVPVTKTIGVDYTVSGVGSLAGGTVNFLAAPTSGYTVTVFRQSTLERKTDYQSNGDLPASTVNADFDRLWLALQEAIGGSRANNTAVRVPTGESITSLPAAASRALMALSFDALGNPVVTAPASGSALDVLNQLADQASVSKGAALVKHNATLNYAVGTLGALANDLLLNVKMYPWLAKGDGASDDTTAIQAALDYIKAAGGGRLHLPRGTYVISSALDITGSSNLQVLGAGPDASIIKTNSATAHVFTDTGTSWWRTFRDFTITASVTRTAGSYFNLAGERRALFERIRMTEHFNGFNLAGFEQTELRSCSITNPSGAGAAIRCGTPGVAGQGANLLINSCFLRGNDDVTQNAPTGSYGIVASDVDAVWGMNTDIGAFVLNDLLINPNTRSANHYFTQCYFDATKTGDGVLMQGTGTKQQITFAACWFASAGKLTSGNAEACNVRAYNQGTYQDILFSGCRVYNASGSGVLLEMPGADFTFTGCDFYANGALAATNRYGLWWVPASVATVGPVISGCKFGGGNSPNDMKFDGNARNHTVTGCYSVSGISDASGGGKYAGNLDTAAASTVASATTITISPTQSYVDISGTTNIGGMTPTYKGHIVVLRFLAALTVVDNSSNLRLEGNFVTVANSTLTLICDGTEWREMTRANT